MQDTAVVPNCSRQFDPDQLRPADDVLPVGEGLKLVTKKTVELTTELATSILELTEFSADRPLKNRHVSYLVDTMRRGTFHPEWVQLIVCEYAGRTYRMNGQHTCWTRIYFEEVPKNWRCPVSLIKYSADNEHAMRMLYASIDRGAARTKSNVVVSYLYDTEDFSGVSKRSVRNLAEGFAMWHWDSQAERVKHDGDEISNILLNTHLSTALQVAEILEPYKNDYKHLYRASVVGAMFATFSKVPTIAKTFWEGIKLGVNLTADDPRLKLRNLLMTSSVKFGAGANAGKASYNAEDLFRICIYAWNAYRKNVPIKHLKLGGGEERPKVQ